MRGGRCGARRFHPRLLFLHLAQRRCRSWVRDPRRNGGAARGVLPAAAHPALVGAQRIRRLQRASGRRCEPALVERSVTVAPPLQTLASGAGVLRSRGRVQRRVALRAVARVPWGRGPLFSELKALAELFGGQVGRCHQVPADPGRCVSGRMPDGSQLWIGSIRQILFLGGASGDSVLPCITPVGCELREAGCPTAPPATGSVRRRPRPWQRRLAVLPRNRPNSATPNVGEP